MQLKTKVKIGLATMSLMALVGCTITLSTGITPEGHVQKTDLIFPKLENAWQKDGQFPNSENLSKIKPGVAKDELYQLIGRPHFSEAQHAYEWDYIFKFYQADDSVKICQYKVIFDKDFKGQEFYWLPEDCAKYAKPQVAVAPVVAAPVIAAAPIASEKINLLADALFAFDKWQLQDMRAGGREELDALAQKLMAYQQRGETRVMITGHTDYLGEDMYNLNLSQLRAQTVREYLISRGVDAATMVASGAGEGSPVKQCDANQPRESLINCLQPNRRVEVAVAVYQR